MNHFVVPGALVILAASNSLCAAAPPVVPATILRPYPQVVRTFYSAHDPKVPTALAHEGRPLPSGNIPASAVASDGAIWLGTNAGVIRIDTRAPVEGHREYFAGMRYLPDNAAVAIVPDSNSGVWIRTRTGVSHIERKPMTLEQKAAHFEERVSLRHDRYGLVADSSLSRPGDVTSNVMEPNDNDGLWTSMYAAAECFRYSVTKSPEALARARKSIDAVLFLTAVTGIPGYPARSFVRKGDIGASSSEWHDSQDGKYRWKGDTSSDEIVGHFFLYSIAYDLLPDPALKKRISETARAIMDHIIDHKYYLVGETGKPTTWGKWSLEYFSSQRGRSDAPLNAMELLSFLKTTTYITGDSKYEREYRKAAVDLGYAKLATRYLTQREEINYSDEELFMLPFFTIMKYEYNPALVADYREAGGQWWQNEQREKNPLWTFMYAISNPQKEVDLTGAVWTLHRIPIDLIKWDVVNSKRQDLKLDGGVDRSGDPESKTLLPADELPVRKWNSNPFVIDGGNGGRGEDDGAYFLLPYWLGRYYNLIRPGAPRYTIGNGGNDQTGARELKN